VDPEGIVQARPVELGPVADGLRVVRKGLGADDRVVISGLLNAQPGNKVTADPGDMNQFLAGTSASILSVNPGSQPQGNDKGQGNEKKQ
jgi:hypothetical protein